MKRKIIIEVSEPDGGGCWISFKEQGTNELIVHEEVIADQENVGSVIQAH